MEIGIRDSVFCSRLFTTFAREGIAMHFGLYLKKKGIITAEQLVDALEVQQKTLPRIGQLAMEEGILSPRQIFEVLRAQCHSPHVRFGELAIEMELMTRDDLMRLLIIQADRKRPIEQILVAQRVLTNEQAAEQIAEYRRTVAQQKKAGSVASKIAPLRRSRTAATISSFDVTVAV
jgi:hypothetical protein